MKEKEKKIVLVNKKTGERLELDPKNVGILTAEEFEKSTLGKRRYRKDSFIDEKVFSDNNYYPSQKEIEDEVEEALRGIDID